MHFTEFLFLESKMGLAHDIYTRAEDEVANQAADEGGRGYSHDAILAMAKKIAMKEAPEDAEAIVKIIADELERQRLGESEDDSTFTHNINNPAGISFEDVKRAFEGTDFKVEQKDGGFTISGPRKDRAAFFAAMTKLKTSQRSASVARERELAKSE